MASIDFIKNRIEGAKKNIAKLEAKIARIEKAKATGWEVNPYYYHEDDLKWTNKDLEAAKKSLAKYEEDLATANDKAASRNVPAITEFLNNWKKRMEEYYHNTFKTYPEAAAQFRKDMEPYKLGYYEERKMKKERFEEWKEMNARRSDIEETFKLRYGFLQPYIGYKWEDTEEGGMKRVYTFDEERFQKDITEEYNRKYDFIIERTNEIVKVITDASGLKVGAKGDLNGFIIGTNGTAKVQTIGAGGYNIQCFHFRTLINRI